ncbi:MAG: 30S ribosomal protein S16 [Tissierellia bacterium]|nr:30S ribosomal protein S16 [Tissierellia bacterium]
MAVKIRLRRMGSNKNPFYRIIVADSRAPRDGRFIEELGYYDPLTQPKTVKIDNEKALKWISNGAKPTDTVDRLFRENNVYETKKTEEVEEVEEEKVEEAEESEAKEDSVEE